MTPGRDLHRVAPSDAQLIPEERDPGKVLRVSPEATATFERPVTAPLATPYEVVSVPGQTVFVEAAVPGRAMGPRGFVRFRFGGYLRNDGALSVNMTYEAFANSSFWSATAIGIGAGFSPSYSAEALVVNQGDESDQQIILSFIVDGLDPVITSGSATEDTFVDWTFSLSAFPGVNDADHGFDITYLTYEPPIYIP